MQTENQVSPLSLSTMSAALEKAQARYLAGNPTDKAGNALTSSADIRKGAKFLDEIVIAHFAGMLEQSGIDAGVVLQSIETTLPMKAIMRMCEFAHALSAGDYRKLDATTVLTILACGQAGARTRDAITFAVTGKGNESTSDEVRDIEQVRRLQKLFPKVGSGTEPTQVSRSFGKNGFCGALGIGKFEHDEKANARTLKVNKGNAFYKTVKNMVSKASDATLKTMRGADKGEGQQ